MIIYPLVIEKDRTMTITIHAVDNGAAFIPIDSVPLKKNQKYRLIIEDTAEKKPGSKGCPLRPYWFN